MQDSILVSIETGEKTKYRMMYLYGLSLLSLAFFFNSPMEIFNGLRTIVLSKSLLLTDYMALGNVGSAFFNAGILLITFTYIAKRSKAQMNGPLIASLFLVSGFAIFGKNIYNVWSIVIGVYVHSMIQKDHFTKYIIIAYFGTALSPIVSLLSFGVGLPLFLGIIIGNLAGIAIGLILPPMASSYVRFHQGFNLYNIGFTAGVIGMLFMSLFRLYGIENEAISIVYTQSDFGLAVYLFLLFSSMIAIFLIYSNRKLVVYKNILRQPGRLVTDFVTIEGFAFTMLNMGILGFLTMFYVVIVGGHFSGPVIGGIFTVVGFGSFGKHPKNTIPVIIGVVIATIVSKGDLSSTGAILTALFATTLAPITGYYGILAGILAGFLHMSLVSNLSYLHGGMNLYNNGFSGGFVAAILVPIFESYRKEESYEE
jgi:hypothetical protein